MFKTAFVAARDRRRLFVIAGVLIGFGFNKVVDRLGLQAIARMAARNASFPNVARLSPPPRARRAIEALGPALGYEASSRIAGRALAENRGVAELVLEEGLLTPAELDTLLRVEAMTLPSRPKRVRPPEG